MNNESRVEVTVEQRQYSSANSSYAGESKRTRLRGLRAVAMASSASKQRPVEHTIDLFESAPIINEYFF